MQLTVIGSNQTQIETEDFRVLFSYNTPVACLDRKTGERFKTETKWSRTTSKHINQWFTDANVETKPQEFFDNLL
jgi:hypothetical protein